MQISAILSDYDGTLCPTTSIRSEENIIPKELENILWGISEKIPVCVVSSKDFGFLHSKTRFASIVSCILGIETVVLRRHKRTMLSPLHSKEDISSDRVTECRDFRCIKNSYLPIEDITLQHNSELLSQLAEEIASRFKEVSIEHKFTVTRKKMLAGITIDWRHIDDWKFFKVKSEPELRKAIIEKQRELRQQDRPNNVHIQTYTTHPFIDIYAVKCDKGMAYDAVISKIPTTNSSTQRVMYLGDSDNDNAAFRKADISIGVKSDERLNPTLDCKYTLKFDKLSSFLEKLQNDNFVFSGL
jgi:hydroxymethylpyrimidine pyrophosphatase-like HAD family hydrolase